jgi:hypothetical protein
MERGSSHLFCFYEDKNPILLTSSTCMARQRLCIQGQHLVGEVISMEIRVKGAGEEDTNLQSTAKSLQNKKPSSFCFGGTEV